MHQFSSKRHVEKNPPVRCLELTAARGGEYSSDGNRTGVSNEHIRAPGAGRVRGDERAVCVSYNP